MPNLALKLGVVYRITAPVILLCSVGWKKNGKLYFEGKKLCKVQMCKARPFIFSATIIRSPVEPTWWMWGLH